MLTKCDLICKKGPLPLKHLKNIQLLCTQPYIFQWMLTNLYLSLKTIDNLNTKFSKHCIKKLLTDMQVFLNSCIKVVCYCKSDYKYNLMSQTLCLERKGLVYHV